MASASPDSGFCFCLKAEARCNNLTIRFTMFLAALLYVVAMTAAGAVAYTGETLRGWELVAFLASALRPQWQLATRSPTVGQTSCPWSRRWLCTFLYQCRWKPSNSTKATRRMGSSHHYFWRLHTAASGSVASQDGHVSRPLRPNRRAAASASIRKGLGACDHAGMFGIALLVAVTACVAGALAATTGNWSGVFGSVFYLCAFIALPLLTISTVALHIARALGSRHK